MIVTHELLDCNELIVTHKLLDCNAMIVIHKLLDCNDLIVTHKLLDCNAMILTHKSWVTRVSLGHSQRDLVAQEVGVIHQVSYSRMKDRNYKSVQQHIFISFSFSGIEWLAPPMLDVIFVENLTQPPLNHGREKGSPPLLKIIIAPL